MSGREGSAETVADRVRAVIEATPPKEGRRSRIGHISIEDFAEMLGTTKTRVIMWTKGTAYPDETNRRRLAHASNGRYSDDDFKASRAEETETLLEALRGEVASLTKALDVSRESHRKLARRVGALERREKDRAPVESPQPTRATRQEQRRP